MYIYIYVPYIDGLSTYLVHYLLLSEIPEGLIIIYVYTYWSI